VTVSATSAEEKPAKNRDILVPGNHLLTVGAKGSSGTGQRDLSRDTIDTDVQE
jgi:hypothetical protein